MEGSSPCARRSLEGCRCRALRQKSSAARAVLPCLWGLAKVVDPAGNDLSAAFRSGARSALEQAQAKGIRIAVLKEGSPSCGSNAIHDGTFSATRVHERGVTAALLASARVRVFSEEQFEEAAEWLRSLETRDGAVSSRRR